MLESLRARLLLWYSLLLLLLVAIYATTVTSVYRQSLIDGVDADLATTTDLVVRAVVPDVEGMFDLNFPPQFRESTFGPGADTGYYAIWDSRGALVDQSGFPAAPPPMPPPGVRTRDGRRELVIDAPGPSRILVGQDLEEVNAAVGSLTL